jgi:tetratricopeptide (TPR) repeat protein
MRSLALGRASLLCLVAVLFSAPVWAAGDVPADPDAVYQSKSTEFRQGLKAIRFKDFRAGADLMAKAAELSPQDPDVFNFLGYSLRKLGDLDTAVKQYRRALELDPKHKGALEYLGEAYLQLNQPEEAKKNLALLDKICWLGCEEYRDLKSAIAEYEKKK